MQRVSDKRLDGGRRQIAFEHAWRPDFVGEALTLEVDATDTLQMMEFYSARFGIVRWVAGQGLAAARRWESEDESMRDSGWSRGYPSILLDGASSDPGSLSIVDAVLVHMHGTALATLVRSALAQPQLPHPLSERLLQPFGDKPTEKTKLSARMRQALLDFISPRDH